MTFEYFNPNPDAATFKSGKPKSWHVKDSAVRAICKSLNQNWETVFSELSKIGKNQHNMPDAKETVDIYLSNNGYSYITYGKPRMGESRPTVEEFISTHNKGTYILYLRDYYVTISDGVLYNTSNDIQNSSVYSYWTNNKQQDL